MAGSPTNDAWARLSAALAERYRIERELGQGGMATVYLAEDLKHKRNVAVKVLKPELAAVLGADRFVQEITTTAALQHPHILPLFDSGIADGFLYYVMPFIDGETLRSKLDRERQLGIEESVRIACEVASALDYAHKHGVIHRDIKPENILLHEGRPMVADFGIALAVSAAAGGRMTETGLSLGTPHYMSPEQATAEKDISARSDVYSLASVLYEMLAGEPPHTGGSAQQIIMKIITEEAQPVGKLRKSVPPNVAAALAKALEKLPADRFATAADFAGALNDRHYTTAEMAATQVAPANRAWLKDRRSMAALGVAAFALIALGASLGVIDDPKYGSVGPDQVVRLTLSLGDSVVARGINNVRMAIDPSGRRFAFVGGKGAGETSLWIRDFANPVARELPDTKGAFAPFFSPDGASVGFFVGEGASVAMKVVDVAGGVPRTVLADSVAQFGGADWGDDGNIYFTNSARGLSRVSAAGGAPVRISRPDSAKNEQEEDYPDVLPGNRGAIIMIWEGSSVSSHIGFVDLTTGKITDFGVGAYARYLHPNLIVIGTATGQVMVAPLDVRRGKLLTSPVLVGDRVQTESSNGTVQFVVSANGTFVYQGSVGAHSELVWVDRTGKQTPIDTTLNDVTPNVALSPDGSQIAFARSGTGDTQVWVMQLASGAISRLSFDVANADRPVWTPDGRSVGFLGSRNGKRTAWIRRADGTDDAHPATAASLRLDEVLYDPQGRYTLLRSEGNGTNTRHLLMLRTGVDTVARPLVQSSFDNYSTAISPDGGWIAFVSTESGTPEIHVRPFPNVDSARFVISVGGGLSPMWSRDGRELFFRNTRGQMFAVPVTTGRSFTHGNAKLLFDGAGLDTQEYYRAFDVAPDGKRFLMVASGAKDASMLNVVFNWPAEIRSQLKIK